MSCTQTSSESENCNYIGFNKFKGKTKFLNHFNEQTEEFQNHDIQNTYIGYRHRDLLYYNSSFIENVIAKYTNAQMMVYDKVM